MILKVDRSQPKPLKKYGGEKILEECSASLALTEIDVEEIRLISPFQYFEEELKIEEVYKRSQKLDGILLDIQIFHTLIQNQEAIPESWRKNRRGHYHAVAFTGTLYQTIGGARCFMSMHGNSVPWYPSLDLLQFSCFNNTVIAVL